MSVSVTSSGLTLCGTIAPIRIGIGLIDMGVSFDGFYNHLDEQQVLYENTGRIMLPGLFGGPPTLKGFFSQSGVEIKKDCKF